MRITGAAAQFGRGVMQDVSAKMMKRFADCLAQEIGSGASAAQAEEPAGGARARVDQRRRRRAHDDASARDRRPRAPPPASRAPRPRRTSPSASSGVSSATTSPPPPRPTDDVLDLGEVSREAVLKRALPVVGVAVALLVLLRLIRR